MNSITYLKKIRSSLSMNWLWLQGAFSRKAGVSSSDYLPIDFVVTWVDGNDPEWQAEKRKYEDPTVTKGNGIERYRDWNQFFYWFRSVEKYAPWVRKIFLVTSGHLPGWLNVKNEKLVVISHKDFIPAKYLPTFSSIAIELNLHRIPGLSECFVYFNDDMYLGRTAQPSDFFENGLPEHCAIACPLRNYGYNGPFAHQLFSNLGIINDRFNIQKCITQFPELWFSKVYGADRRYNRWAYAESYLSGMLFTHLPTPFRKSTMEKVWEELPEVLDKTCSHRFRNPLDVMHQIFSLWEIMSGNFVPVEKTHYGKVFGSLSKQHQKIAPAFQQEKYLSICINDSVDVSADNYYSIKASVDSALEKSFPEKSSFEV